MPSRNQPDQNAADNHLTPRHDPVQQRSRERAQRIIDVTGELLERVGFDDLNTTLIAREVGISVGSLYHYFPNKHAILYAMASQWLEGVEAQLDEIDRWPLEDMPLDAAVERLIDFNLRVYRRQKAMLPLVQAMFSVPDLRELDLHHDELVISRMAAVFRRLGIRKHLNERGRIARLYLEMTHSLYLVVVNQNPQRAKRTLSDLKLMCLTLLQRHYQESREKASDS
ncbi:TetR family transcriptional regulator [Marinobacterium nitratireducens]|uniref:TetR family transcriptional regulator n=1 Tax=Marinobacterium nitratireducens TaxID=518897 RepID=A0A918DY19_9GAMM|nr:TetR/AcrR family transcriptional regulator [Marinobacterium nitratireducens]GGO88102.1 TetR family transcriptional regulator [Marinobacterium nitratireducens]